MPEQRKRKRLGAPGTPVSADQVTRFRLGRHHLARRAAVGSLLPAVSDMGGAQAQILGAAQTSLWARVEGLEAAEFDRAIWDDRRLTRAWCMRRTLYLVPSVDLAMYVRGTARRAEKEVRWLRNRGVPSEVVEPLLEATLGALDEPRTRSELTERLGRSLGLPVRWRLGGGWGSRRKVPCLRVGKILMPAHYLLHLAGARGVVCSGPTRDGEATFVRGDGWVPGFRDLSGEEAERALLRRYLRAFGPATPEDFMAWTSVRLGDARAIWSQVEGELAEVDVEGRRAWILRNDLADLARDGADGPSVRLLPYFDGFLLGHRDRGHLIDPDAAKSVYRSQGWVAPVVLVDGRVRGVWSANRAGGQLDVRVQMFRGAPRSVRSSIREEADDLGRFLGAKGAGTRFVPAGASVAPTTVPASP